MTAFQIFILMLRNNSLKIYLHFDVISKYEQVEWQILRKTQSLKVLFLIRPMGFLILLQSGSNVTYILNFISIQSCMLISLHALQKIQLETSTNLITAHLYEVFILTTLVTWNTKDYGKKLNKN